MTKQKPTFSTSLKQAALNIYYVLPMVLGVLGLAALLITFINPHSVQKVFTGNTYLDTIYGMILGSIMMGNALISYILGSELQHLNISLYAITAFLLSWVTIGYVQIPMEISFFGKRFVLIRNVMAFIFSFFISLLIVLSYEAIK